MAALTPALQIRKLCGSVPEIRAEMSSDFFTAESGGAACALKAALCRKFSGRETAAF
jgi:hypothetical protein